MVTACDTLSEHRGINTDHLPILMELSLGLVTSKIKPIPNFKEVDWEEFQKSLAMHLGLVQPEEQILN